MITRVRVWKYRGFERFDADLAPHAFLIGPNSAGKSTVVEALGLAEKCLKVARRRKPSINFVDQGRSCQGHPIPVASSLETDDPIRFEFGDSEARLEVEWESGAKLHMVWPTEDEDGRVEPRFWLEGPDGRRPGISAVADLYPPVFVVPVISPVDHFEELKSVDYIQDKVSTRLASRHFRNHLRLLDASRQLDQFLAFAEPWLPELRVEGIVFDASADRLGVFYIEPQSRVPKELAWAGDGLQIWLQLLWHLYRARNARTVVLDEPEVYLHPDLQRRLVRLLEDLGPQIVLASHSSEVVTEALPASIVWIDRKTRRSRRGSAKNTPRSLSESLGSNYNLSLVRSLRTRVVVAIEARDTRTVRTIARKIGARAIAAESDMTVVPLRSFSSWANPEPLRWIASEILSSTAVFAVLLSADCRPEPFNQRLVQDLEAAGIRAYMWPYRELDNIFLIPPVLARATATDEFAMDRHLREAFSYARDEARKHWTEQHARFGDPGQCNPIPFDDLWSRPDMPGRLVSPELVLSRVNEWLQADGYRELTLDTAARASDIQYIPADILTPLLSVDELHATTAGSSV